MTLSFLKSHARFRGKLLGFRVICVFMCSTVLARLITAPRTVLETNGINWKQSDISVLSGEQVT